MSNLEEIIAFAQETLTRAKTSYRGLSAADQRERESWLCAIDAIERAISDLQSCSESRQPWQAFVLGKITGILDREIYEATQYAEDRRKIRKSWKDRQNSADIGNRVLAIRDAKGCSAWKAAEAVSEQVGLSVRQVYRHAQKVAKQRESEERFRALLLRESEKRFRIFLLKNIEKNRLT